MTERVTGSGARRFRKATYSRRTTENAVATGMEKIAPTTPNNFAPTRKAAIDATGWRPTAFFMTSGVRI